MQFVMYDGMITVSKVYLYSQSKSQNRVQVKQVKMMVIATTTITNPATETLMTNPGKLAESLTSISSIMNPGHYPLLPIIILSLKSFTKLSKAIVTKIIPNTIPMKNPTCRENTKFVSKICIVLSWSSKGLIIALLISNFIKLLRVLSPDLKNAYIVSYTFEYFFSVKVTNSVK